MQPWAREHDIFRASGKEWALAPNGGKLQFAKSPCTMLKGFLSPWRRFFGLGLHADSSIRENARRERGLCLAGFQKRIWLSEKQLLNLRCHRITMVQATESRKGLNLPFTRRANFSTPTCWRVLRESEMRPVLVIQLDNATPIILNREKSVTFGTLCTLALWLFTKPSPEMASCVSVWPRCDRVFVVMPQSRQTIKFDQLSRVRGEL
jgi:hypothetical protein